MKYQIHSFRNAQIIFENDEKYSQLWQEVQCALTSISDEDIIEVFNSSTRVSKKSISDAINKLIDDRLIELGWNRQSPIFNDSKYRPDSTGHWWTLDFSKDEISIEVAFNHGEAVAWNLIKVVLAGELNHVEKAVQTSAGIIITATDNMKKRGNYDGATGSYEKFLQYLDPLRNILTIPMIIIGLEAPETFFIDKTTKKVRSINELDYSLSETRNKITNFFSQYGIEFKSNQTININNKKLKVYMKSKSFDYCVIKDPLDKEDIDALQELDIRILDITSTNVMYIDNLLQSESEYLESMLD